MGDFKLWQNSLLVLKSDRKPKVDTPIVITDDGTEIETRIHIKCPNGAKYILKPVYIMPEVDEFDRSIFLRTSAKDKYVEHWLKNNQDGIGYSKE